MFRNLLVPLDGSPFAEQALPWATGIARRSGGRIDLVHVAGGLEPASDSQEEYLAETIARLRGLATTCAVLVDGSPARALLDHIQAAKPGLVIMATHARGPLGRVLLGGITDELVRRAAAPVLLVHGSVPALESTEPSVERILIALDGSRLAEKALEPGLALARLLGARCTLLRVLPGHQATSTIRPHDAEEEEAHRYLRFIASQARHAGVWIDFQVAYGSPARTILEQARPNELIALATHGRGGISRLLLGSVADQVIRGATQPVLVCRAENGN